MFNSVTFKQITKFCSPKDKDPLKLKEKLMKIVTLSNFTDFCLFSSIFKTKYIRYYRSEPIFHICHSDFLSANLNFLLTEQTFSKMYISYLVKCRFFYFTALFPKM